MADPLPYTVSYSFAGFQANAPAQPLPGSPVDNEFANIASAVSSLVASMKDVRRSDGGLKNGIVTLDSISAGVLAGLMNLDPTATGLIDAAIAAVQTNVNAQIADLGASKANTAHTHAATDVSVAAITGIVAVTVQAAIAELRGYAPQTGDLRLSIDDTVAAGWIACDDGTIGPAGSSASNLASATAWPLYNLLWTKVSDTYAPVTGARGLSAAFDFAALKPIALTKMLGRALAVSGSGSGLSARTIGQIAGEETHLLTTPEIPAHVHANSLSDAGHSHIERGGSVGSPGAVRLLGYGSYVSEDTVTNSVTSTASSGVSITNASAGGDGAHNNMQPTAFLNAFLKL